MKPCTTNIHLRTNKVVFFSRPCFYRNGFHTYRQPNHDDVIFFLKINNKRCLFYGAVCENPSGEDWVRRDQQEGVEGGEGEDDSPGEEAKIRKLHRMKVYL